MQDRGEPDCAPTMKSICRPAVTLVGLPPHTCGPCWPSHLVMLMLLYPVRDSSISVILPNISLQKYVLDREDTFGIPLQSPVGHGILHS